MDDISRLSASLQAFGLSLRPINGLVVPVYHALALHLRSTVNVQLVLFTEKLLSYFHSMFEVGVENLIKSLLLGLTSRGGVLEDTFSSPWPWPRRLKSLVLALASKSQVLENCPVFGSRTALFFEPLKFCWKTPETSRKI